MSFGKEAPGNSAGSYHSLGKMLGAPPVIIIRGGIGKNVLTLGHSEVT
jgi:hypothetical protein